MLLFLQLTDGEQREQLIQVEVEEVEVMVINLEMFKEAEQVDQESLL